MAPPVKMAPRQQPITTTGVQGFLMWLRDRQPYLYRRIEKKLPAPQLAGLGLAPGEPVLVATASPMPSSSSTADMLKNIILGAGQVLLTKEQLKAQQKILDLQLERARQGFPPADIDPTEFGLPAPTVKVGIDAETKKLLLIAGGIGGAGLLLWLAFGDRP